MEVVFYSIFNFFTESSQQNQWKGDKSPQEGHPVRRQAGQEQGGTAEYQEINHSPQKEGQHHINPELSAPHGDGVVKKPCRNQDPEQQVQGWTQQGQPNPAAEGPKEIVDQPQGGPQ